MRVAPNNNICYGALACVIPCNFCRLAQDLSPQNDRRAPTLLVNRLQGRIKKIMQGDEDVGKVPQQVSVMLGERAPVWLSCCVLSLPDNLSLIHI